MNKENRARAVAILLLGLVLVLVAVPVLGAGAESDPSEPASPWWVFGDGGGQVGACETLMVVDTLGQTFIGPAEAGSAGADAVSVGAGYWYGAAAVLRRTYLPVVLRVE